MPVGCLDFNLMKKPEHPELFQSLMLPKREVPDARVPKYRIFTDRKHYITVEAENAQDALTKSGINNAHHIEFYGILLKNVIMPDTPDHEEPPAAAAEQPPLSNADIDKLLQN